MRYTTLINNVKTLEWKLNLSQAYTFAWIYELPSWADKILIENEVYYFASALKAAEELPVLTSKKDTIYRIYKQLQAAELINIKKIDGKDYVCITAKGKTWNEASKNKASDGRKKIRDSSDNFPTDNIIIDNINKGQKKTGLQPELDLGVEKKEPPVKPKLNNIGTPTSLPKEERLKEFRKLFSETLRASPYEWDIQDKTSFINFYKDEAGIKGRMRFESFKVFNMRDKIDIFHDQSVTARAKREKYYKKKLEGDKL